MKTKLKIGDVVVMRHVMPHKCERKHIKDVLKKTILDIDVSKEKPYLISSNLWCDEWVKEESIELYQEAYI